MLHGLLVQQIHHLQLLLADDACILKSWPRDLRAKHILVGERALLDPACRMRPERCVRRGHYSPRHSLAGGALQQHSLAVLCVFWIRGADSKAGILQLRHGACARAGDLRFAPEHGN